MLNPQNGARHMGAQNDSTRRRVRTSGRRRLGGTQQVQEACLRHERKNKCIPRPYGQLMQATTGGVAGARPPDR